MHQIEITARARDDADREFVWLATNVSPAFAESWYQGLFEQIETLAQQPARCPVAAESPKFAEEVRELVYVKRRHKHKYRILFSIRENLVSILTVRPTSRRGFEP